MIARSGLRGPINPPDVSGSNTMPIRGGSPGFVKAPAGDYHNARNLSYLVPY
jgi:hypothetical protein